MYKQKVAINITIVTCQKCQAQEFKPFKGKALDSAGTIGNVYRSACKIWRKTKVGKSQGSPICMSKNRFLRLGFTIKNTHNIFPTVVNLTFGRR